MTSLHSHNLTILPYPPEHDYIGPRPPSSLVSTCAFEESLIWHKVGDTLEVLGLLLLGVDVHELLRQCMRYQRHCPAADHCGPAPARYQKLSSELFLIDS